jgi:excisionase family DNA binding protein
MKYEQDTLVSYRNRSIKNRQEIRFSTSQGSLLWAGFAVYQKRQAGFIHPRICGQTPANKCGYAETGGVTMESKHRFLTRQQASEFLNVKKSTLEAWAVRGGGPAYIKMGRAVRYGPADLLAWVESRITRNTSEV